MNPKAARLLSWLQGIVRLVESPPEIAALGHAMAKQQAGGNFGICPHVIAGSRPFGRSLVEGQWGFLLEEITARNKPQFEIPILRLGSQTIPAKLLCLGRRRGGAATGRLAGSFSRRRKPIRSHRVEVTKAGPRSVFYPMSFRSSLIHCPRSLCLRVGCSCGTRELGLQREP